MRVPTLSIHRRTTCWWAASVVVLGRHGGLYESRLIPASTGCVPREYIIMSGNHRVSFGKSTDDVEPILSSSKSTPMRSALKPGTRNNKPDPVLYQHPDPLIRRLRLYDGHGKPVDLKRSFRDTKVVAFYFSSQFAKKASKDYDHVRRG